MLRLILLFIFQLQVTVVENSNIPLRLIKLNVSSEYAHQKRNFRLVDPKMKGTIAVDPLTGEVYLTRTLDRERVSEYKFKVLILNHGYPIAFYDNQTSLVFIQNNIW